MRGGGRVARAASGTRAIGDYRGDSDRKCGDGGRAGEDWCRTLRHEAASMLGALRQQRFVAGVRMGAGGGASCNSFNGVHYEGSAYSYKGALPWWVVRALRVGFSGVCVAAVPAVDDQHVCVCARDSASCSLVLMYVDVCVHVYVHVYVDMDVHVFVDIDVYVQQQLYVYMYMYLYRYMYMCSAAVDDDHVCVCAR